MLHAITAARAPNWINASTAAMSIWPSWVARLQISTSMVRVPGAPIEPRHAWNHLKPLSRRLTFEITTHSQHHLDPDRPYHRLEAMPEAPQLPGVWFCFLVSFAPPLWHRMMQGYLAAWDRQHANAAERDLATAANAAAGWA